MFSLVRFGQPLFFTPAQWRVSISINDLPRRPKVLRISFDFAGVFAGRRNPTVSAAFYKRFFGGLAMLLCGTWKFWVVAGFNASVLRGLLAAPASQPLGSCRR